MGQFISLLAWDGLRSLVLSTKESKVLMVGLDAAGKTTILFNLKLNEVVSTIPTIGFNVESIQYRNISFTVWDIGGQDKLRKLWQHYYDNTNGIIFVVDSSDSERIAIAREELHTLISADQLRNASLLVYANKQDLPNAMSASEVGEALGLTGMSFSRNPWYIQPACATTKAGLYEGLDWLAKSIK